MHLTYRFISWSLPGASATSLWIGKFGMNEIKPATNDVLMLATEIFGEKKATRWLNKPKQFLDGQTPIQKMQTHEGLAQIEELLVGLREGYF